MSDIIKLIVIAGCMMCMMGLTAHSCTVSASAETIEAQTFVADYIIKKIVSKARYRKLYKDDQYRQLFASDIAYAADMYSVPAGLLTVLIYHESSFKKNARGQRGERGLTQIMPRGPAKQNCDLDTRIGQLECGARWLKNCRVKCSNWYGALMAYKTGYCESMHLDTQVKILARLRMWTKYRKQIRDLKKMESDTPERADYDWDIMWDINPETRSNNE